MWAVRSSERRRDLSRPISRFADTTSVVGVAVMNTTQLEALNRLFYLHLQGHSYADLARWSGIPHQTIYRMINNGAISTWHAETLVGLPDDPPVTRKMRVAKAIDELDFFEEHYGSTDKAYKRLAMEYDIEPDDIFLALGPQVKADRLRALDKKRAKLAAALDRIDHINEEHNYEPTKYHC